MFRSLVFLALASGVAYGAWSSLPEAQPIPWRPNETEGGFVRPGEPDLVHQAKFGANESGEPAYTVSRETIEAIQCGPWDVSDAGMEAILEEMIRRGWTPPTRAAALAHTQPQFGLQVLPIDPDAPAAALSPEEPTGDPLSSRPVEALEPDQPASPSGPSRVPSAREPQPQFTN
jgi:hypothetical protein